MQHCFTYNALFPLVMNGTHTWPGTLALVLLAWDVYYVTSYCNRIFKFQGEGERENNLPEGLQSSSSLQVLGESNFHTPTAI